MSEEPEVNQEQLTTDLVEDLTFAVRELQKWYLAHDFGEENG